MLCRGPRKIAYTGICTSRTNLSFRAVQLDVKRAAEAARRRERELLFSNLQAGDNSRVNASRRKGTERIGSADAIVTDASSDVVAALRRTHTLLASELARSRFAQETLEQSARALSDLSERYSRVDDLLGVSKALVGELFRSKKSDSWYLATALYILVGTLGWLIFRRLLWGPFWLLIWFPLKTVFNLLLWVAGGLVSTFKASVTDPSNTTTLKIQSSATGRSVPWPSNKGDRPFIRAGMGGTGAKTEEGKGAEPSTLEQIGRMTDQTRSEEETASASKETAPASSEQPKPPTAALRGDGKPLVESTEPRNPKKRMWEESNTSAERDEL